MTAKSARLVGKTALITGAAQGLGAAMVRRFVEEGARVIATDRDAAALQKAFCDTPGVDLRALDVTVPADWEAMRDALGGADRRVDILVNNAGIASVGDIEHLTFADWRKVHAVNLDGVFLGIQSILPCMKSRGGSIITIASVAALVASGNTPAYNSSKAAVVHLTKSVALHCARHGYRIRANAILPVFARTAILENIVPGVPAAEIHNKLSRQIPLGELLEPEDVAHAAVYLASDESRMVTGSCLVIDGGLSAM